MHTPHISKTPMIFNDTASEHTPVFAFATRKPVVSESQSEAVPTFTAPRSMPSKNVMTNFRNDQKAHDFMIGIFGQELVEYTLEERNGTTVRDIDWGRLIRLFWPGEHPNAPAFRESISKCFKAQAPNFSTMKKRIGYTNLCNIGHGADWVCTIHGCGFVVGDKDRSTRSLDHVRKVHSGTTPHEQVQ